MCGIAGIIEDKDNSELIKKMVNTIKHRGPDAQTTYVHKKAALGHVRLSIIDLSTGDQPLFNDKKDKCIIYNGEVYNYENIRSELIAKGVSFNTSSDTEVVLKAYEHYGADCLNMLNGIFAFVIYDLNTEDIFIARDHFGIKPLHYYFKNDLLIFGSEQKSILEHPAVPKQLNKKALHLHLNLRYTQGNETLFKGIKRLPPGYYLTYKNGELDVIKYWSLRPRINHNLTESEAIEGLNFHLKEAVRRQLVSDVPIGVYLSGGLDSSALVQKMSELGVTDINTFTLGFNEPTDEFPDARLIAERFGTIHRESSLTMNPLSNMEEVIWHAEEPKINLLQGYHMSAFVNKHVKVVLGGLGGDELFAGYDIHKFIFPFNKWHRRMPQFLQKLMRWKADFIFKIQNGSGALRFDEYRRGMQMLLSIGRIEKFYLIMRNVWDFDLDFYKNIYSAKYISEEKGNLPKTAEYFMNWFQKINSPLDDVLLAEFNSKMVNDYLLVDDRMSMAHGIEERVPFLDRELVDYGFSIPIQYKIKNNQTKALFRKAMKPLLPKKIVAKKKWGFTVNPYLQFKKDLKQRAEAELTKEYIDKQGIFNYDYIKCILDYPAHPKLRWHYNYIWILLGLKIWEEKFGIK
ncbi:MAG: asparagine synthase (glutamine-hydrolyzing) [Saprospiraceae bacterium]